MCQVRRHLHLFAISACPRSRTRSFEFSVLQMNIINPSDTLINGRFLLTRKMLVVSCRYLRRSNNSKAGVIRKQKR